MKPSSNPLRKLVGSLRSRSGVVQADPPPLFQSDIDSGTGSSEGDEREAERQEILSLLDPLLPALLAAVKDYQLTHGSLIKLVLHPATRDLPIQHTVLAQPIGVSLVPTLWPKDKFDEAWGLQPLLQELYAKVASDPDYLWEVLKDCIASENRWSDEIVSGLWRVYEEVLDDPDGLGHVQDVELGLCRGDWMLGIDPQPSSTQRDQPKDLNPETVRLSQEPTLKQVELNAIATAGVSHSNIVSNMHHHLLRTGIYSPLSSPSAYRSIPTSDPASESISLPDLPPSPTLAPNNNGIQGFARALAEAHHLYGPPKSASAKRTAVLMVVQHNNVNIADERPIEYALWEMHPSVPCFRCEYQDILEKTWFDPQSSSNSTGRELLFSPFTPSSHITATSDPHTSPEPSSGHELFEIAVIYLRSSLDLVELSSHTPGLATRLHLERSRAIKCPTVLGQLAACKKVQQHLSSVRGAMERFISSEDAERLRARSMEMVALEDTECELRRILDEYTAASTSSMPNAPAPSALPDQKVEADEQRATPASSAESALSKYVLKPIGAEGGGHCIFGAAIPPFYASRVVPENSQAGYVLMQRIHPPVVRGAVISQRGYFVGRVVSELGILGSVLWRRRGVRGEAAAEERTRGASDARAGVQEILTNKCVGWTLKSKSEDVPEMSVIKGYGCFDTPCLVDWETYREHASEGLRPGDEDRR